MKYYSRTIGDRTRYLPAFSAVPQPTAATPLPGFKCAIIKYPFILGNTHRPCFMPYSFNAMHQFMSHHNLCSVIFSLISFSWLHCYTNPLFLMGISSLIYAFLMYVHFFRNATRA